MKVYIVTDAARNLSAIAATKTERDELKEALEKAYPLTTFYVGETGLNLGVVHWDKPEFPKGK